MRENEKGTGLGTELEKLEREETVVFPLEAFHFPTFGEFIV